MMPVGLLCLLGGGAALGLFLVYNRIHSREESMLQALATRRGGKIVRLYVTSRALEIPLLRTSMFIQWAVTTRDAGPLLIATTHTSLPRTFEAKIYRERPRHGFMKSVGVLKDVKLGSPLFDQSFIATSNAIPTLQQLMVPSLQHLLVEFLERDPELICRESSLEYREPLRSNALEELLDFEARTRRVFSECEALLAPKSSMPFTTLVIVTIAFCFVLGCFLSSLLELLDAH